MEIWFICIIGDNGNLKILTVFCVIYILLTIKKGEKKALHAK